MRSGEMQQAAVLAFRNEHNTVLFKVLKDSPIDMSQVLEAFIEEENGLDRVLVLIRDWNTSRKHANIAQKILAALLKKCKLSEDLKKAIRPYVAALSAYSEKHFSRMTRVMREAYKIQHVLGDMKVYN